jgi:hypothetical protein
MRIRIPNTAVTTWKISLKRVPYVSMVARCKFNQFRFFRSPVRNQRFSCQAGQCDSWRQFQGMVTIGRILWGPLLLDLNLLKGQLDEIFDHFFQPLMVIFYSVEIGRARQSFNLFCPQEEYPAVCTLGVRF